MRACWVEAEAWVPVEVEEKRRGWDDGGVDDGKLGESRGPSRASYSQGSIKLGAVLVVECKSENRAMRAGEVEI